MNDIPNPITPMYFYNTFVLPIYFDDDLDSYQKLLKIQYKVNEIIKNQTGIIEWLNQLKEWVDTQLEYYTKEQLNEWLNDGTLRNLINNALGILTVYDTTEDLIATNNLVDGMRCSTNGYYALNDGGGAEWYITSTPSANDFSLETATTGLKAVLFSDKSNVLCYGIKNDNTTDNGLLLQRIIDLNDDIFLPPNTKIYCGIDLNIYKRNYIHGSGNSSLIRMNKNTIFLRGGGFNVDILTVIENFTIFDGGFYFGEQQEDFANNVIIDKIWAFGHNTTPAFLTVKWNSWNFKVQNCTIQNYVKGVIFEFTGIANSGANIAFDNCSVYNIGTNGFEFNGVTTDGYNITLNNSSSEHCGGYSIYVENGGGGNIQLSNFHMEISQLGYIYLNGGNVFYKGGWANPLQKSANENHIAFNVIAGLLIMDSVRILAIFNTTFNVLNNGKIYVRNNCVYPYNLFTPDGLYGIVTGSKKPNFDVAYYRKKTNAEFIFYASNIDINQFESEVIYYFRYGSPESNLTITLTGASYGETKTINIPASASGGTGILKLHAKNRMLLCEFSTTKFETNDNTVKIFEFTQITESAYPTACKIDYDSQTYTDIDVYNKYPLILYSVS